MNRSSRWNGQDERAPHSILRVGLGVAAVLVVLLVLPAISAGPYPIDGYEYTGIRRLERLRLQAAGKLSGTPPPPGAQKAWADIRLNRPGEKIDAFPAPDPVLQKAISGMFAGLNPNYGLALLDITPGRAPRYASYRSGATFAPGSVGKLAILAGLFEELRRIYPRDTEARRLLLKNHAVRGGTWVVPNSHTVPLYNVETGVYSSRTVQESDVFTLYEWADHMISASSNAAASLVWKEVILMRAFGSNYPPTAEQEKTFWAETPAAERQALAISVVNDPLRAVGIEEDAWRLGTMFTAGAQRVVPGSRSHGTPQALVTYLLRIEEGAFVDEWSSLEMKRLMYQTQRRIRYASSPALATAAVYFKSGSLYRCKAEEGFSCGKYQGNVDNYMNSVSTVETEDGRIYLVAVMSNVLRKNSAAEHQALATRIETLMALPVGE